MPDRSQRPQLPLNMLMAQVHEAVHLLGRMQPQFLGEQDPEALVCKERLSLVSLRQVDADEDAMCTFPKRVGTNGGIGSLHGFAEAPSLCESVGQGLTGVHAELLQPFSLG